MSNQEIKISIIEHEKDIYAFQIDYGDIEIKILCRFCSYDDLLLLLEAHIEGPGTETFGRKIGSIITEICEAFCNKFERNRIVVVGGRRTVGKTKGTFLAPIYRRF